MAYERRARMQGMQATYLLLKSAFLSLTLWTGTFWYPSGR